MAAVACPPLSNLAAIQGGHCLPLGDARFQSPPTSCPHLDFSSNARLHRIAHSLRKGKPALTVSRPVSTRSATRHPRAARYLRPLPRPSSSPPPSCARHPSRVRGRCSSPYTRVSLARTRRFRIPRPHAPGCECTVTLSPSPTCAAGRDAAGYRLVCSQLGLALRRRSECVVVGSGGRNGLAERADSWIIGEWA